ncbi:MAG: 2-oxoacid:acceptor oxidoreductase family protein [Candidatus Sedimenticola sp. (ex Thyasira tokunagai)]
MYRIRFHGRGGQGMKTASRILGTAFFLEGYEVQDAPRYGAERRGAPIFAFVRADHKPINERGIIPQADLVVVADDTLVPVPAAGVLAGTDGHTVLLINSHLPAATWQERLNLAGPVVILPAGEGVEDRAALPYIGVTCAGAAACLLGIGSDALERGIRDELEHLGGEVVEKNLAMALAAYWRMEEHRGRVTQQETLDAESCTAPAWIDLPFEGVDLSAPTIHNPANSEQLKTGLWRTMRPQVEYDLCNRCWWVCSSFCPDGAITVDGENFPHIDYDHCKGCLICVAQCPPHAITAIAEYLAQQAESEGDEP